MVRRRTHKESLACARKLSLRLKWDIKKFKTRSIFDCHFIGIVTWTQSRPGLVPRDCWRVCRSGSSTEWSPTRRCRGGSLRRPPGRDSRPCQSDSTPTHAWLMSHVMQMTNVSTEPKTYTIKYPQNASLTVPQWPLSSYRKILRPLSHYKFLLQNSLLKVSFARKFLMWTVHFRNKSLLETIVHTEHVLFCERKFQENFALLLKILLRFQNKITSV